MYCSACDEVLVDNITIPATGVHTEVSIPGREATCTEEGLTEGVKCSVCGEILTAQNVIDKKAHDYQKGVCTVCGEKDPAYTPAPIAFLEKYHENRAEISEKEAP